MRALAFISIFAVAIAALAGLSWYVLLLGAAALSLISAYEQRRYRPRLAALDTTQHLPSAAMASLGNSLTAAAAAYALGAIVRFAAFG
jgi:hypothetical protein